MNIAFFSIHELGWKTWANQLKKYSVHFTGNAHHVPLATPLWVRALSRPIAGRSLVSERAHYARRIKTSLKRLHAQQPIDLLIASPQRFAPHMLDFCRQHNVKLAIAMDTTGPIYTRDLLHQPTPPAGTWAEEQTIYNFADLLIPWSTWVCDSLVNDFNINPAKIAVTPPAVTIPPAAPPRPAAKIPNLLFVGNDFLRKGGPRLLSWHQTHFQSKAHLHIVSAKAPKKTLPNVTFHGAIPREKLLTHLLPTMDLFCLPTSHDMSPFAIAEAQAAGLPVVSSQLAGIPDLVLHNASGILAPPADDAAFINALNTLITNPDLREKMSRAARTHAQNSLNADTLFPNLMHRLANLP